MPSFVLHLYTACMAWSMRSASAENTLLGCQVQSYLHSCVLHSTIYPQSPLCTPTPPPSSSLYHILHPTYHITEPTFWILLRNTICTKKTQDGQFHDPSRGIHILHSLLPLQHRRILPYALEPIPNWCKSIVDNSPSDEPEYPLVRLFPNHFNSFVFRC